MVLLWILGITGGGSLEDAKKISGFFIENGPIVQVRDKEGGIKELIDDDESVIFDRPVVVLVNKLSGFCIRNCSRGLERLW